MNKKKRFDYLFQKYEVNTMTPREYEEFVSLLSEDSAQDSIDVVAGEDWDASISILHELKVLRTSSIRKRIIIRTVISMVASISVLLGLYLFWPTSSPSTRQVVYRTDFGQTKSITLTDGSNVLLNANSTLHWDLDWQKNGGRSAVLDGEAFFEVRKVGGHSFEVESGDIDVKVLGTAFNVRTRNGNTDVFLDSGTIDLEVKNQIEKSILMKPGDLVLYKKEEPELISKTSSMERSASWVEGMLEFQNRSLEEILLHFEELYGKKFKFSNDDVLERRMDLSLPYSDWDLIKKALELSLSVEFKEVRDTVVVN